MVRAIRTGTVASHLGTSAFHVSRRPARRCPSGFTQVAGKSSPTAGWRAAGGVTDRGQFDPQTADPVDSGAEVSVGGEALTVAGLGDAADSLDRVEVNSVSAPREGDDALCDQTVVSADELIAAAE